MCLGACFGSCAAACCCTAVSKACGFANSKSERFHKVPYTILIFFSILVAIILRAYHQDLGFSIYPGIHFTACSESCQGDQAVYRISLALALFFAFHAFIIGFSPFGFGRELHTSYFGVKTIAFIGMVIGVFYIAPDRMDEYADACRVISLLFLVFQTVAIIDYAYTLHFWMIDKNDHTWDIANLAISGLMYAASVTIVGLLFHWFADGPTCGVEKFVLSMTLIVPFVFSVLSVTEVCPHGALFPSAAITGYVVYIAYTAMLSSPKTECNVFLRRGDTTNNWELAVGIFIAAASVTFTTWNVGSSSSKLFGIRESEEDEKRKALTGGGDNKKDLHNAVDLDNDDDEEEEVEVSEEAAAEMWTDALVFHILMTIASMYACMLLTSWSTDDYSSRVERYSSVESFWVKVCSQWLIMILYTWTLLAPTLFPDRDFS